MLITFSLLAAPEVVKMKTCRTASDKNLIQMMTFPFQCTDQDYDHITLSLKNKSFQLALVWHNTTDYTNVGLLLIRYNENFPENYFMELHFENVISN